MRRRARAFSLSFFGLSVLPRAFSTQAPGESGEDLWGGTTASDAWWTPTDQPTQTEEVPATSGWRKPSAAPSPSPPPSSWEGAPSSSAGHDIKAFDWVCPRCQTHNFARRVVCMACKAPCDNRITRQSARVSALADGSGNSRSGHHAGNRSDAHRSRKVRATRQRIPRASEASFTFLSEAAPADPTRAEGLLQTLPPVLRTEGGSFDELLATHVRGTDLTTECAHLLAADPELNARFQIHEPLLNARDVFATLRGSQHAYTFTIGDDWKVGNAPRLTHRQYLQRRAAQDTPGAPALHPAEVSEMVSYEKLLGACVDAYFRGGASTGNVRKMGQRNLGSFSLTPMEPRKKSPSQRQCHVERDATHVDTRRPRHAPRPNGGATVTTNPPQKSENATSTDGATGAVTVATSPAPTLLAPPACGEQAPVPYVERELARLGPRSQRLLSGLANHFEPPPRPGDWRCPHCRYINFGMLQAPMRVAEAAEDGTGLLEGAPGGRGRPAGKHPICRRCHRTPLDFSDPSAPATFALEYTYSLDDIDVLMKLRRSTLDLHVGHQRGVRSPHDRRREQAGPRPPSGHEGQPSGDSTGAADRADATGGPPSVFYDWRCFNCAYVNYSTRTRCNRCGIIRDARAAVVAVNNAPQQHRHARGPAGPSADPSSMGSQQVTTLASGSADVETAHIKALLSEILGDEQ